MADGDRLLAGVSFILYDSAQVRRRQCRVDISLLMSVVAAVTELSLSIGLIHSTFNEQLPINHDAKNHLPMGVVGQLAATCEQKSIRRPQNYT